MASAATQFRAGAASVKITPDEAMWLAGFAVRTEPAKGRVSDLFAKALAIEDSGGHRAVIVSIDLIAISRDVAMRVCAAANERFGLARDQILLCATHTHYGPELRPDKVPFFHIPPEYAKKVRPFADRLTMILIDLIGDALKQLKPAILRIAQSTALISANRRQGEDPTDHDVPILRVTDERGAPLALLFGYACHNTTIPPADCEYCGDWSGFACETLQQSLAGTPVMFLAGAGADQNPNPKGTVETSHRHAATMTDAVLWKLSEAKSITGSISTAFEEIPLEYQPLPSRAALEADLQSDKIPERTKAKFLLDRLDRGEHFDASYPCPIQTIRIGDDFLLIAIGGEPVIDYAVNLKQEFGGKDGKPLVWVVGYANDMFGYVPTPRVLRGGGYEGTRSVLWSALPMPFTESVEERVLAGIRRLVKET